MPRSAEPADPDTSDDRVPTYIAGLDLVLGGGLPPERSTLVAGGPGAGKSVLAMEFVARGAARGEPGVFLSFEQSVEQLRRDFSSFAADVPGLIDDGTLLLRQIEIDAGTFQETGPYTLDALKLRIAAALDEVGGKRLAMDTLDTLFAHLRESETLRGEVRNLFEWLHEQGVTAVITAEQGDGTFTRHGIEAYVSDCVIVLDHRILEGLSTRRARVLKYRGAAHNDDEHPFLIDAEGFSLIPILSINLEHDAPREQVSTGISSLDGLIEGGGYFRGSSTVVSGTAGTGKSSVVLSYLTSGCQRGERALYLSFEESEPQIRRNMESIGIDLGRWLDEGLLRVRARRPAQHGLETHLTQIERLLDDFEPRLVVVDPITNLITVGSAATTRAMLTRLVDMLKERGITALYTALVYNETGRDRRLESVSSVMDNWIILGSVYQEGERKRTLHIQKSRGLSHSHALHELTMTGEGLEVGDAVDEPSSMGASA